MAYSTAILLAAIVLVVAVATEVFIRVRSPHAQTPNGSTNDVLHVSNSHSRIDAPDRHFREALDTIAADVKNVTRNNEAVVAALAPIEVALRTFSNRLTELEGRVDEIISKHSLRDSRAVRHEGQLAKQMGLLKGFDLRLAALADQMATAETAAEGASVRVVDAPALEIISPQREEKPEQITSDHSGTTLEGDDSYTA